VSGIGNPSRLFDGVNIRLGEVLKRVNWAAERTGVEAIRLLEGEECRR